MNRQTDEQTEKVVSDQTYNAILPWNGMPIKAWTRGVPLEDALEKQLRNVWYA